MAKTPEPPPRGPWSDLPPPEPPKARAAPWRRVRPERRAPRPAREPIIRNWKGLLIVLFLLLVAPILANWAAHVILGFLPHSGF